MEDRREIRHERHALETVVPLKVPYRMDIEIFYGCNFKCNFCPLNNADAAKSKKSQMMSFDTFKEIITSYIPFCVLFFTFESKVSDNPFTLGNGYGICLHSGFRQTWDEVTLIGWSNSSTVPQISALVL